eukprot:6197813-Pleurochrysis_carterae.AAC.1
MPHGLAGAAAKDHRAAVRAPPDDVALIAEKRQLKRLQVISACAEAAPTRIAIRAVCAIATVHIPTATYDTVVIALRMKGAAATAAATGHSCNEDLPRAVSMGTAAVREHLPARRPTRVPRASARREAERMHDRQPSKDTTTTTSSSIITVTTSTAANSTAVIFAEVRSVEPIRPMLRCGRKLRLHGYLCNPYVSIAHKGDLATVQRWLTQ